MVVSAFSDDGAGPGIVRVAGVEIGARAGKGGDGLLRRFAVGCGRTASDGAAVLLKPQEQRVRVHRAGSEVRAVAGGAGVVPAEVQVRRELALGNFRSLARVAYDPYLLPGPNLRTDEIGRAHV